MLQTQKISFDWFACQIEGYCFSFFFSGNNSHSFSGSRMWKRNFVSRFIGIENIYEKLSYVITERNYKVGDANMTATKAQNL